MSVIFKTLFEVKMMHEFYLTAKDGKTVFALPNQTDRINFLFDQFAEGYPSINSDMEFIFPPELEEIYNNLHLKVIPTYSGFRVLMQVNQKILADGSLIFEPLFSLPGDFNIYILLKKKSNLIESYTHTQINNPITSAYIFSNENISGAKTFPFLTNPVSAFNGAHLYSQGDIASYGVNDIREYYNDGTADKWETVAGSAFENENDRLLVPILFYYSFINYNNITEATFILKDKNDNSLKTINVANPDLIQKVVLDFSDLTDTISIPETFLYEDIIYSLEVTGSNGYTAKHHLIFNNNLFSRENWGVINIKPNVTNSAFNLLANDGYLIKRRSPAGIWSEAPIFEIPIKSKFPFWRFINEKGSELKLAPLLMDYLFKEDKILLSKRPRSVAGNYFLLQKEGSTDTVYVPNPLNYELKKDDKERLCFDIMVPESDLFPVV